MNIENMIDSLFVFFQTHLYIGIAAAVLVVVLFFLRPGATLKILAILLFLGLILYFISIFGGALSTGVEDKGDMIHNTEKAIE